MNVAIISPSSRGTGITSLAILLGIALKNKSSNVVVTSIADKRSGLRDYIGNIKKDAETVTGMKDIQRMAESGTISAKDIQSYCINRGVEILPRAEGMDARSVSKVIDFISKCNNEGKPTTVIVDVDIDDMRDEAVRYEVQAADVVIIVLNQSATSYRIFRENRENMARVFSKKKVFTVVNRYENFAGTLKDIWGQSGMKYGDNWFEVRYNKCVPTMTSRCFISQIAKAMADSSDPDVATLKADMDKLATAVAKCNR